MTPARLFGSALFFALLAASEAHYSAQRGPTLLGLAEAVLSLACAVVAWQRAAEGWAMWRRGIAWELAVRRAARERAAERRRQRDAVDRALGNGGHP